MNPRQIGIGRRSMPSDDPVVEAIEALAERIDKAEPPKDGVVVPAWMMGIIGALLVTVTVALATAVINQSTRLSVIEGNRFTPENARRMQVDILNGPPNRGAQEQLNDHEGRIIRLEGYHERGNTP